LFRGNVFELKVERVQQTVIARGWPVAVILKICEVGNLVLRKAARSLSADEIRSCPFRGRRDPCGNSAGSDGGTLGQAHLEYPFRMPLCFARRRHRQVDRESGKPPTPHRAHVRSYRGARAVAATISHKLIAATAALPDYQPSIYLDHTVRFHVSSILAKLGAATRTEAVSIGMRRGLVAIQ